MTVAELIEELSEMNPRAQVILSSDSGNSFSLCEFIESGIGFTEENDVDFVSDEDLEEEDNISVNTGKIAVCLYGEEL